MLIWGFTGIFVIWCKDWNVHNIYLLMKTKRSHSYYQTPFIIADNSAADLLAQWFLRVSVNGAFTMFATQSFKKRVLCFTLQRLFSWQRPITPDPSFSLSPLALHSVFSHLPGNQRCMLLCWCLSTAKVSPLCLMDLPVRFSVRFKLSAPAKLGGRALPLFVPGCHWVEAGWRWDTADNGLFVLLLDVLKLCSCGPGDAWSNRDTQRLWKRLAMAHSPHSAALPTRTTFCSHTELLPSQPFTHIKALFHTVGTLTFAFCWLQWIFLMLSFFQVITQRSHTPLGSVWGLLFWGAFDLFTRKTLHRHYLIQPSLSRERCFSAVHFACELSFLLFFFFLLDWLVKEAQSSPQILSGVRNRGGITLNYCTF